MVPSISSNKGFTADLRIGQAKRYSGHKSHTAIVISVLGLALLLASLLHPTLDKAGETSTHNSAPSPKNNSYVFKVYTLNNTSTKAVSNGTALTFDISQLPVNFSGVKFGDYRIDSMYSSTYYAGSGILLNSSGTNASITLKEGNGKIVSSVFYRGQTVVALNGQTRTYVNSSSPATYSGTDMMVQDWRNGNWTPNDGIIIEHPNNITISGATFYLAVYQPGAGAEIPEFDLLPAIASVFVVVVLARRFKK